MTLSSPTSRPRGRSGSGNSSSNDYCNYMVKPRRARSSTESTISSVGGEGGSSSSSVLRVSKEVENIGARVAVSKKRVTWCFVLAGSEQVHTLTLEHSRISAKKRLRLDGRELFTSEQYAANWHYDFHVGECPSTSFRVVIQDITTSVLDQGKLETIYDLMADGVSWDSLAERFLPVAFQHRTSSVWSSDVYVRRVEETCGELLSDGDERPPGTLLTWTFAFGVNGSVHKLELRDLEKGEFVVVLDCRELERVNFDDIKGDVWEFEYDMEDQHELDLVVTLVDEHKTYDLFIDGTAWRDISQTDFVLESGWYPVYSRSRSAVYFRHEGTGDTQWEKPIVDREDSQIKQPLQGLRQASLSLEEYVNGLYDASEKGEVDEEPENEHDVAQLVPMKQPLQPVQETPEQETLEGPEAQVADLMDFSEEAVTVQKFEKPGHDILTAFDSATHPDFVQAGQQPQ